MDPLGTTGVPASRSISTVLNAASEAPASSPPRSAAVRNLPGTTAPSSRSSRVTSMGRSVYCRT
ncbi:hypothetical protein AVL61_06875 [Kocuria rosea subsp. polaris]|uniref:Uncharacterized protein n=1 Tax=Kocuria rosea subsp. polaris TaxID=136273 RepID=A0A0W8I2X2_KOCRO|nr:hypothetical protein AVL61_06875 [Kocuria polaris]